MDDHTVVQLKAIAKERGIRGYYKLRKTKLIHASEATRLVEQTSNIFDEQIPNDLSPDFKPTPWRPSNNALKISKILKISLQKKHAKTTNFFTKGFEKFKDFGE